MSNFYVISSGSVLPIEEVTLADGTTTKRAIDSTIGQGTASTSEMSFGTTPNSIYEENIEFTPSTRATLDTLISSVNSTDSIDFIFVKLVNDEEISIQLKSGGKVYLHQAGDFFVAKLSDSQGIENTLANQISFGGPGTSTAKVSIFLHRNYY
jgi:hypothetical protein